MVYLQHQIGDMSATATSGGAFEVIFRQYYEGLCRYAALWIRDPDDCEEIVQNVFVRLWEKREQLSIDSSLKAYLYKSVYHAALNMIRHNQVKATYAHMKEQQEQHSELQSAQSLKALEQRIEKALETLPEQCRLIFSMSRFQELKYREIAEVLNISVKTVENQMGKALRLMRHNLADFLSLLPIIIHLLTQNGTW